MPVLTHHAFGLDPGLSKALVIVVAWGPPQFRRGRGQELPRWGTQASRVGRFCVDTRRIGSCCLATREPDCSRAPWGTNYDMGSGNVDHQPR